MATDPVDPPPGEPAAVTHLPVRAGRNLPAAIGVGAAMGGLVILTLFTVKATFLLYMGIALAIGLAELAGAFAKRDIRIPVIPVAAGGTAVITCAYWLGPGWALAALALTVAAILAWRLAGGPSGYVRDVTAGIFATIYVPFLAAFVAAMLVPPDGAKRVLTFVILTISSDIGGYFAGITLGRGGHHLMAPVISPKKTWEGFASTAAAPVSSPCQAWPCSISVTHSAPAARPAATEPAKPSQVFFGLMTGAIRWWPPRPSVIPAK